MFEDLSWLYSSSTQIGITILTTILIYAGIIIITRIAGLRTFAKMSSFDFAITIAIGSLLASILLMENQSVVKGMVALGTVIGLQAIVARLRKKSDRFENAVTNTPVLLMRGETILHENLDANRVTLNDLYAKLREANVTNKNQVLAVVLETTGDISVLRNGKTSDRIEKDLLRFVAETPPEMDNRRVQSKISN